MNQIDLDSNRSAYFVAGDRFEFETHYEGRIIIYRGRITKFVAPDYFEGFLDIGTFVCGNSKALKQIPRHIGLVI